MVTYMMSRYLEIVYPLPLIPRFLYRAFCRNFPQHLPGSIPVANFARCCLVFINLCYIGFARAFFCFCSLDFATLLLIVNRFCFAYGDPACIGSTIAPCWRPYIKTPTSGPLSGTVRMCAFVAYTCAYDNKILIVACEGFSKFSGYF